MPKIIQRWKPTYMYKTVTRYGDKRTKWVCPTLERWTTRYKNLSRERERGREVDRLMGPTLSRSPKSNGWGKGGWTRYYLLVRILWIHQGDGLHTPDIWGQQKETLNRFLVSHLDLGGSLMGGACFTSDPNGTDLSNASRMCGLIMFQYLRTSLNNIGWSLGSLRMGSCHLVV